MGRMIKTACSKNRGIPYLSNTYKILSIILLSRLIPYAEKSLGIVSVDCNAIGQLLIIYSAFVTSLRKNGNTVRQCIGCLETSGKLMHQLGGRSCIIFSFSLVSP